MASADGDNQDQLIPLAGPGHWNDPDMVSALIVFFSIPHDFIDTPKFSVLFQALFLLFTRFYLVLLGF